MDLGTLWGSIGLDEGPFRAGLGRSLVQLNGWKGAALKIAAGVGATFGAIAVGGFVKNSISAFADFESNLNQIEAATDVPAAGLERLSDLALQLGKDTVFSAGEASGAMLELAKSGMTPAQIEAGALAASLKLAAAGGMGLEAAATATANAINMFGLEAKDANAVANALAGGANASSASVESLAQGLSQVGPGARNAGMSLEETVAVLAAFDNAGIKGSDAGTSLKTMLTSLTPSTDAAADAMRKVGLMTEDGTNAFINADGTFKSMSEVAGLLDSKLGGLSQAQRTMALETIFGSDASRAATALMNMGTEGIQKNLKATRDKTAADRMAEARMKGLKGAFENLGGSIETLGISLLIRFGPALTASIEGLAGVFNLLGTAINGIGTVLGPVAGFLGEHETLLKGIAITITALLLPAFVAWATFATIAAVATVRAWAMAAASAVASGATQLLWMTTMGLKFIWLGIQAMASAVRIAAAWLLSKASVLGTIVLYGVAFAMMAAGWIATAAAAMAGAIATAAAWLVAIWPIALVVAAVALVVFLIIKYWDQIKSATSAAWKWVVAQVKKVPGLILGFFLKWTLPGLIITHWSKIKSTFSAGVAAVVAYMKSLPSRILSAIGNAGSWLLGVGKDIMGGLRDGIEAGFDWVREKLQGVGRVIPGWLKSVLGISSPSKVMRDQVGQWIPAGVADGITKGMPGLHRAVGNMASATVISLPSNRLSTGLSAGSRSGLGADSSGGVLRMRIVNFDPMKDYIELVAEDALSAEVFKAGVAS